MRIYTNAITEVAAQKSPGTLTIIILANSMDVFDSQDQEVEAQIHALNKALAPNGRVLLRPAAPKSCYFSIFEELGFRAEC